MIAVDFPDGLPLGALTVKGAPQATHAPCQTLSTMGVPSFLRT
jgi:hypothetical protein